MRYLKRFLRWLEARDLQVKLKGINEETKRAEFLVEQLAISINALGELADKDLNNITIHVWRKGWLHSTETKLEVECSDTTRTFQDDSVVSIYTKEF
jgi:hypothetical protein